MPSRRSRSSSPTSGSSSSSAAARRSTPGRQLTTIAATLAGVAAARVSYVWGRRAVGRRVNPTRFDAVEAVRTGLSHRRLRISTSSWPGPWEPGAGRLPGRDERLGHLGRSSRRTVDQRRGRTPARRRHRPPRVRPSRKRATTSSKRWPSRPQPRWTTLRCVPSLPGRSS